MYNKEFLKESIQKGAEGDVTAAVEACQIVHQENILAKIYGTKPVEKKTYGYNELDKGFTVKAKRDGGICPSCKFEFKTGDLINIKTNKELIRETKHQACVDNEVPF